MLGAKVKLNKAEEVKEFIIKNGFLKEGYGLSRLKDAIIFPVIKKFTNKNVEFVKHAFKVKEAKKNWKEILQEKLSRKEFEILKTAHDIVGSIAILEIPEELEKKESLIAKTLLSNNKNVETVLKKAGQHEGTFRTQKMKWLAGEKTKETVHKENNVRLKLNVEEVYFSSRLSTERKRIMKQVKKGEDILVMFSGCAPYPCVLAKNTEADIIFGIEMNPVAHKYGIENVKLNKLSNVELIKGDVNKEISKIDMKFDRICMPLPKSAEDFLELALSVAKKGSIINFYDFLHENEFDLCEEKVKKACKKAKLKYKVLNFVKCGQYSPGKFRVCLDFKLE